LTDGQEIVESKVDKIVKKFPQGIFHLYSSYLKLNVTQNHVSHKIQS
jgi:hypothetical protein